MGEHVHEYTRLSGLGFKSPKGGTIAVHPDADVVTVGPTYLTENGVGFGPLEITTLHKSLVGITDLRFREEPPGIIDRLFGSQSLGDLLFGSVLASGAVASRPNDERTQDTGPPVGNETAVSRRDVLLMSAAAVGVFASSTPAQASDRPRLEVARLEIDENDDGALLRITDVVADVLPTDTTYYVRVNDDTISEFVAGESAGVIPPGMTGTVDILTDEHAPRFTSLGSRFEDNEIAYDLELEQPADEYDPGTGVVVSSEPIVTEPVRTAGREKTVFTLGDRSVPHRAEREDDVGYYTLRTEENSQELIYRVGSDAPSYKSIKLRVNVSRFAEARDDTSRLKQL